MGLDLTIMPLKDAHALEGHALAYDRLRFDRDYQIFGQIADLSGKPIRDDGEVIAVQPHPLPPKVKIMIYEERGLRMTRKNSYGEEMVYATAGEMRKIKLPKDVSRKNKAIMAYIRALTKDTLIILEWG